MALDLKHQTTAQFVGRFRERFRSSSREDCARMATWLIGRFEAGDLTATQIRNAFNLDTQAKWDTFRTKLLALRDHWVAVQAAEGE